MLLTLLIKNLMKENPVKASYPEKRMIASSKELDTWNLMEDALYLVSSLSTAKEFGEPLKRPLLKTLKTVKGL